MPATLEFIRAVKQQVHSSIEPMNGLPEAAVLLGRVRHLILDHQQVDV